MSMIWNYKNWKVVEVKFSESWNKNKGARIQLKMITNSSI